MIKSFIQPENIIKEEVITPGEELGVMSQFNGMLIGKLCPVCSSPLIMDKCSKCGYEDKHYEA